MKRKFVPATSHRTQFDAGGFGQASRWPRQRRMHGSWLANGLGVLVLCYLVFHLFSGAHSLSSLNSLHHQVI
ncbi:MAG: hypothetical protein AAF418_06500, partial [Pseudomonadota bacterium]